MTIIKPTCSCFSLQELLQSVCIWDEDIGIDYGDKEMYSLRKFSEISNAAVLRCLKSFPLFGGGGKENRNGADSHWKGRVASALYYACLLILIFCSLFTFYNFEGGGAQFFMHLISQSKRWRNRQTSYLFYFFRGNTCPSSFQLTSATCVINCVPLEICKKLAPLADKQNIKCSTYAQCKTEAILTLNLSVLLPHPLPKKGKSEFKSLKIDAC